MKGIEDDQNISKLCLEDRTSIIPPVLTPYYMNLVITKVTYLVGEKGYEI